MHGIYSKEAEYIKTFEFNPLLNFKNAKFEGIAAELATLSLVHFEFE